MIETAVTLGLRVAALFGIRLSPFMVGAIVAAIVATGFAGYSGYLVRLGYEWAESKCEAASLRDENEKLKATLAEKQRELAFANGVQERDAKRAADAENQLRANQEAINATPANSGSCLSRDAAGRVRNVR